VAGIRGVSKSCRIPTLGGLLEHLHDVRKRHCLVLTCTTRNSDIAETYPVDNISGRDDVCSVP
jgi:hypothetical protein